MKDDLAGSLPPLPEPHFENHDNGDVFGCEKTYFYTADQMRAYAALVREQTLEEAAKVAERLATKTLAAQYDAPDSDMQDAINGNIRMTAVLLPDCAAAIRALKP